ncbi:hypothetical protein O2K51_11575 [Apibacter raozihei]|uniref:hypothetical protein n=1 Tax=Apibacter TaxID=1778601 RepID=UPI000FE2C835|nr:MULTISPECIES: hypothetical protein [Apibacter]
MEIKTLAERLLGRQILTNEGTKNSEIEKVELKYDLKLPKSLKDLYLFAGKNTLLLEAFNRFALPAQLEISDNKMVFLEENQNICYWGFEIDKNTNNPKVYQLINENEWYEEQVLLNEFLTIMLYYQCAQGGYEYCATSGITFEDLDIFVHTEWEDVVRYNGLQIYWKADCLLWYVYDKENKIVDDLYFSARTQEAYKSHVQKYELEEL